MLSQASDNLKKVKADRESLNKKQDTLPNENRKAPNFNDGVIPEMVKEEDNYSSIYYTLEIDKSFDLFELRDFFFSFMFSKQRKGHIYMNILDTKFKGSNEEKDKLVLKFLQMVDWLGLEIDFDKNLKNKIYESQRLSDYSKWINLLLDQREAFRCFCKTRKCEGKCESSSENTDSNKKSVIDNKDVTFIKFKSLPQKYSIHEIITGQEIAFNVEQPSEFNIFIRKNIEEFVFSPVFKRVVEDEIFKITHKFESKEKFDLERHHILTKYNKNLPRALLFKEKKYALLPDIKIMSNNPSKLTNYSISYLKEKQFLPETILNEAALLGWGLVDKETEYEKIKNKQNDHLLLDIANILNDFNINRVDPEKAVFYHSRLYYLNNKSMIRKFIKSDEKYRPGFVMEFKAIFKGNFKQYEKEISKWNEDFWQKIVELPYIDTFEDIPTRYKYLFDSPNYIFNSKNKQLLKIFLKNKDRSYVMSIINDLTKIFEKLSELEAKLINRELGLYVYKKQELDSKISNENIYSLLKFILTGDTYGPYLADVCVILGRKQILSRLKSINLELFEKNLIPAPEINKKISSNVEKLALK